MFRLTALTVRSLCLPRSSRQRSLPCQRVCALLRNGAWQSAACPRWKMRLPPILRLAPKPNIKSIVIGCVDLRNYLLCSGAMQADDQILIPGTSEVRRFREWISLHDPILCFSAWGILRRDSACSATTWPFVLPYKWAGTLMKCLFVCFRLFYEERGVWKQRLSGKHMAFHLGFPSQPPCSPTVGKRSARGQTCLA